MSLTAFKVNGRTNLSILREVVGGVDGGGTDKKGQFEYIKTSLQKALHTCPENLLELENGAYQ